MAALPIVEDTEGGSVSVSDGWIGCYSFSEDLHMPTMLPRTALPKDK